MCSSNQLTSELIVHPPNIGTSTTPADSMLPNTRIFYSLRTQYTSTMKGEANKLSDEVTCNACDGPHFNEHWISMHAYNEFRFKILLHHLISLPYIYAILIQIVAQVFIDFVSF